VAVISVHSGMMVFGENRHQEIQSSAKSPALKVLIIGNFSGATDRSLPLHARKHLRIDADSFDEVFARLGVSIAIPFSQEPLKFASFDELHPDHLYDNAALFNRFRHLKKQLQSPSQFDAAVSQLWQEGIIEQPHLAAPTETKSAENLLDSLLSGTLSDRTPGIADQLIQQVIAPYVQPKEHPKAAEYVTAVDFAVNQVMRQIMHSAAFQQLEASWRGLDFLQRRLDLDHSVHLSILDVTSEEIRQGALESENIESTDLWQNLQAVMAGKGNYDVILVDEILLPNSESLQVLKYFSQLAEKADAILLAGADLKIAGGVETTSAGEKVVLADAVADAWSSLRQETFAERVFVAAPRVLLRLPYGKATAQTEQFRFEELPENGAHEYYLWGNGAYLLLCGLLQNRASQVGASFIDNLPLHIYRDSFGDETIKPCAETYLTESQVSDLENSGFTVLQSVRANNRVMIQRWRSLKA